VWVNGFWGARERYLFSQLLICMRFQLIYNLIMDRRLASIAAADGKIWSSIYISHSIPLSLSLSHTHSHSFFLSLSLSHSIPLSLSLSHTLTLTLSLFHTLSHTHTHTHTHSLILSLSLSHSHTLTLYPCPCLLMGTHLLTQKRLFIRRPFPLFRWG